MEIRVLRYFLTIAREGSITSAAEQLHITQPTLSDMKNVHTGPFGKVNSPKEQYQIMNENYSKICLEFAGICRRYRLMLDEKFKEIEHINMHFTSDY